MTDIDEINLVGIFKFIFNSLYGSLTFRNYNLITSVIHRSFCFVICSKIGSCSPGQLVWVDCNLCLCNKEGRPNPICALMWCAPPPTRKQKNVLNDSFLSILY